MFLIYLISLALCIWFGPKVAAVIDKRDVRAEITTVHALTGLILGLIPAANILFLFFGAKFLYEIDRVLKATHPNAEADIREFNRKLRETFDE